MNSRGGGAWGTVRGGESGPGPTNGVRGMGPGGWGAVCGRGTYARTKPHGNVDIAAGYRVRVTRLASAVDQPPADQQQGTRPMHLVNGTGQQPVSGTADPRSSQTGQLIQGLR